jgi:uncharacterized protein (TIGR02996 family)
MAEASGIPNWPDAQVRPFLSAMRAGPGDHTAALVFADWLEERDDPRADMIRASCELDRRPCEDGPDWRDLLSRVQQWSHGGPMLEAWIGEMSECYFWVAGPTRGLLRLQVNNGCGRVKKSDFPGFFAAYRQGWVDQALFGGLPSAVFEQCPLVRSVLLGVDRLELYAAPRDACDDDLARVAELPNLTELAVEEFRGFTDAGLAHLRNHPRLERVSLSGEFTSEGRAHLRTLPRLRDAAV